MHRRHGGGAVAHCALRPNDITEGQIEQEGQP